MLVSVLLALALTGSAASFPQSQADVSLAFQDLGPVLTGPQLGLPAGQGVWWPTAAVLPDGRIRLYYQTPIPPAGPWDTDSAISSDGVHFTAEPGKRWTFYGGPHIEHLPDGRWRLFYVHNSGNPWPDGIASAISTDGLTLTAEPGLRLANPIPTANFLSCCAIVRLPGGGYRMYVSVQETKGFGSPPPKVYSAVSSDLFNWTLESGIRLMPANDPGALANSDGSTTLAFGAYGSALQTAFSADGLTFSSPVMTNISDPNGVGEPAFVTLPDGRVLMYYDRAGAIDAAVAVRITAPGVTYPSPAAEAITATSARVSAVVDPHGDLTTYSFEYGRSSEYGDVTDPHDLPAGAQQTVSATLAGLSPSTTYHFRVDARNTSGETDGADQSFRTASCPLRPARDKSWEVAVAHANTRTAATGTLRRARRVARRTPLVERDGCADYETAIPGLTRKVAVAALRRATKLGFRHAALEHT